MKHTVAILLCFLSGTSFAQSKTKSDLEAVKESTLASARDVLGITPTPDGPTFQKGDCTPQIDQLHAGKPFVVRSLIQLTEEDLQRLRKRIRAAQAKDPNFIGSPQTVCARQSEITETFTKFLFTTGTAAIYFTPNQDKGKTIPSGGGAGFVRSARA